MSGQVVGRSAVGRAVVGGPALGNGQRGGALTTPARSVVPERRLTGAQAAQVGFTLPQSGLVVGRDNGGRPVSLRLFGPRPLRATFVGGWWAAQILMLRCLGYGANIAVEAIGAQERTTGTLATLGHWLALDRAAGGTGNRVWPVMPGHPDPPGAAGRPLVRLRDTGPGTGSDPVIPAQAPWRTELTVLPRLTQAAVAAVAGAQVVLVQRISPPETELAASALGWHRSALSALSVLDNAMVAVVEKTAAAADGRSVTYVWLTPTRLERMLFG
ncbi:MAG: hypothetical protein J2P15_20140 [Micromonosporaceae bacterium]|nr:hypothetical protein [Micromonosporaceae bacterium]